MLETIKRLFDKFRQKPKFNDEDYARHYELKKAALERILGPMYNYVGHAIIPFDVGGPVDMYRFANAIEGTAFATMELIEPDGKGPKPSRSRTFELIAFTKHKVGSEEGKTEFEAIELRIRRMFTTIARYSYTAELNPEDTFEVPADEDDPSLYAVFDEWKNHSVEFQVGDKKHLLLLCIQVLRSEIEFAMKNGSKALLQRLKEKSFYPYSDLDREPVA